MNKIQKLQLSNEVVCWLSKETAQIQYIIKRLKDTAHIKGYLVGGYSINDIELLEEKIKELECRSSFESRNIKKIRYEI